MLLAGVPLVLIRVFIAWTGIFILIALVASIMSFEYWLFDRWFPEPWWLLTGLAAGVPLLLLGAVAMAYIGSPEEEPADASSEDTAVDPQRIPGPEDEEVASPPG